MVEFEVGLPPPVIAWIYELHKSATLNEIGYTLVRFNIEDAHYSIWIKKHANRAAALLEAP